MQKSSVTMLMTEFAHCKYGLFSLLQCGNHTWYTQEERYELLTPGEGCILGGEYTVLTMELDNDERYWILSDVLTRAGLNFAPCHKFTIPVGSIMVGTDIGCVNGVWSVVKQFSAHEKLSEVLEDISSFTLYINRHTAPMKSPREQPTEPLIT